MVKIYCIEDNNGLKYIGSTKQKYLCRRLAEHKYKKDCSCKKLNMDNCKIFLLEECNEDDRLQREQYYINNTRCVNQLNTTSSKERNNELQRKRRRYYKFIQEFRYLSPNLFL